jgi:uncharacterized protein (DUF1778 family)
LTLWLQVDTLLRMAAKAKVKAKDKMLRVRITSGERAELQAAADADQRKLSDWIRVVALRVARSQKAEKS